MITTLRDSIDWTVQKNVGCFHAYRSVGVGGLRGSLRNRDRTSNDAQ